MKILDWYILKKYLTTFITIQLLFVPIAIIVNLADNIDKILANEVPFDLVAEYYFNFTIYFANSLLPLFLFLSVIWFTSKLASDTEVIAFLSSGISFFRFLRSFLIGASIIAALSFLFGLYIVPNASKDFNEFSYKYLKGSKKSYNTQEIYRKISANDYIYLSQYNPKTNVGSNFTLEHFNQNKLEYKISANTIRFLPSDSIFRLSNYSKRILGKEEDIIINKRNVDTSFAFKVDDLLPIKYIAETLSYNELISFIEQEKMRGSSNIGRYEVVKYKKWSIPFSVFVLTIMAFSVSSVKRRGGIGVNLAFGIVVAMIFVFFDKVFGVMAQQSDFSPFIAVWFPNLIFGTLAIYLLYNAKK
jgi:lipopolysaccharide export system permease protein